MTNNQIFQECDLEKNLASLEQRLPLGSRSFTFERETFPPLPAVLRTSAIETQKTYKYINDCYRIEVVQFRAPKKTFRYLGLAILAVVFCPEMPELRVDFAGPHCDIRSMTIRYEGVTLRGVLGYLTKPLSFEYHPEEVYENPWRDRRPPETGWPSFCLKYPGSQPSNHWEERDEIEGLGGDDASVLLASLLLNFGKEENNQKFVKLETVLEYGGVSKFSPEVQFHLLDSEAWHVLPEA